MKKELVIAAYDRDYSWVQHLADVKITVYRKGEGGLKPGEIFMSPNVGRDVHTFFKHILDNYDTLSDITFFSQDYPFDHVSNYVGIINGDKNIWNQEARQYVDGCWFFCTQYGVLECDKYGAPHHPGLEITRIWDQLFEDMVCPDKLLFTPTGHFGITAEQARKIPVIYYEKIIDILETDPTSPWVVERLEPYILLR
jgi:hypothetical protein